jgi:hypothetical protein
MEGERFRDNAIRHSQLALERAEAALAIEHDRASLRGLADRVCDLDR